MFCKISHKTAIILISLISFYLPCHLKADVSEVQTRIPVVLSSDKNFAPPLYVTLFSILKNANRDTFYDFYLLISKDFDDFFYEKISALKKYYTCDIHFIKIDDKMLNPVDDDASIATYYRLLAADMIPQCQKCIYLDADVIVLSDLTELYNIDLGDNYIAGVKDLPSIFTYEKMYWNFLPQKIDKISDLLDFSNYVNGGVLVMNLELIRKHKINEKFKFMVQHGIDDKSSYPYHDQDIINIACNGHIKCIDLAYNFMSNFISVVKEKLDQTEYTAQQLEAIITSPVIIHYAMEKPWNQPFNDFFAIWWRYAHEAALQGKLIQISNKFNEI